MANQLKEERFSIQGMRCAACANSLEKMLNEEPSFKANVNFAANLASIEHSLPEDTFKDKLETILTKAKAAGFSLYPADADQKELLKQAHKEQQLAYLRLFGSAVCTLSFLPGMIFHEWMLPVGIQFSIAILSEVLFAFPILKSAWNALKHFSANMDTLVSLATLTALIYSSVIFLLDIKSAVYFDASVTVITFILLGRIIEGFAKRRARSDIDALGKLLPNTAQLISNKNDERKVREVQVSSLRAGDVILARTGDGFPGDGIIIQGHSDIDEQAFSGESMPVSKKVGDKVFAGTINLTYPLDVKLTEVGRESALGILNNQALKAVASRPKLQRLADYVSAIFTPFIILVSILTLCGNLFYGLDFQTSLIRAVAVLVVACPCALGLATPIVFLVGISRAAKEGILFKDAQSIEKANKLGILAFDKTGTLTEGKPEVVSIYTPQGIKLDEVLPIIQALEQNSEHPLARAFSLYAKDRINAPIPPLEDIEVHVGGGIQSILKNRPVPVLLGNRRFLEKYKVIFSAELEQWAHIQEKNGCSLAYLAVDSKIHACVAFADKVRPESAEVIHLLKEDNIASLILSGDSNLTTQKIASELKIKEYFAPLTPKEKSEHIAKLEEESKALVGMIGDGINDSIALAKADLSFSIGSASILVQDKIDVLLIHEDLRLLNHSLSLAHNCMRKAKQNLALAFGYNSLAIPAAAFGFLSPEIAALLMALSSITVVINALTLRKWHA